jgi:hypothetical protein
MRECETVRVRPVGGGWLVSCRIAGEPLAFLSVDHAQASADTLAARLASLGRDARVLICDDADRPVAARWFPARQRKRRGAMPAAPSPASA